MSYYEKRYLKDDGQVRTGNVVRDVIKWVVILMLVFGALGLVGTYTGLLGRWFAQPAQIFSPENVRAQWQFAYDYDESLAAIARQDCTAIDAVAAAPAGSEEATQRRSQMFAIEQNYARVEGEYNGRLRDAFRAKLVRPADVPETAPTLAQMHKRVGC